MYVTVFDLLAGRFQPLTRIPRWRNLAPHTCALIAGLLIVTVLVAFAATAVLTSYHYLPLIVLGIFCGGVVSKFLSQFLAPKIQSHVTAFLGGITTGNIASSGAGLSKFISGAAAQIDNLAGIIPHKVDNLAEPVKLSLWIGLLTTLVILAANAYYAGQPTNEVGKRVTPAPPAPIPPAAAAAAVGGNQAGGPGPNGI